MGDGGDGDGTGFGGDAGFGGEGDFGGSAGLTGSEGVSLGGDMGGLGFGDFGGLGDGFGDAGNMSMTLGMMFSDPTITEGLLGDLGFSDLGDFGSMSYGQSMGLDSAMQGFMDSAKDDTDFGKVAKALMSLAKFSTNPVISNLGKFGSLTAKDSPVAAAKSGLATALGMVSPGLGLAFGLANQAGLTDGLFSDFAGIAPAGQVAASPGGEGMGWESALPGLAGMYAGYQGMKDSGNMLGSLQSLYSQDSPYAQALRKQLQRQDAQGGRRSQYGPREVELQAKLAQMASNQIPAMNQLQQRQNINRAIMMQQGLGAFNKMGGIRGLKDLISSGWGGSYDTAASDLLGSKDFSLGSLLQPSTWDASPDWMNGLPDTDWLNGPWGG